MVFLPLQEIKSLVVTIDSQALDRDTLDVFVRFEEDCISLIYKQGKKDITGYTVEPYL
ncbi:MAG: hypothetical protein N2049_06120 [Anaerolineales bacterium]|nr:hypothetical protein [Anaerolineales bacterium]MCX7608775.1 hypothetical protein [Anaerolineales bacterium]